MRDIHNLLRLQKSFANLILLNRHEGGCRAENYLNFTPDIITYCINTKLNILPCQCDLAVL